MSKQLTKTYDSISDRECLERTLHGKFTTNVRTISYRKGQGLSIVAFDNITPLCADIYLAGVGDWCSRTVISHFLHFAFDTLKVKRIVAYIDTENEKSIKFSRRLGFKRECTLRGLNVYQYSLLKKDSKYYGIYKRFI